MVRAVFTVQESLVSAHAEGLVGLDDLQLVQTVGGPVLFASGHGGGHLTGYDLGTLPGQTAERGHWQIDASFLQLESVELIARDAPNGIQLFLAGLGANGLRGLRLDSDGLGPLFDSQLSYTAPGTSLSQITEISLFVGGDQGVAALRGGGFVSLSFGAGNLLQLDQVDEGTNLNNARVSDLATFSIGAQHYAVASYGAENSVAMYHLQENGNIRFLNAVDADHGLWVEQPSAINVVTDATGTTYAIVAAPGSDSLSVVRMAADGLQVVDHVTDTRDTRFDSPTQIASVSLQDHRFVLAAGADMGLSLFALLPGGRLQHLQAFEATSEAPLNGITALEALATPTGIRIWVATEAAPFLSELFVSLETLGLNVTAPDSGGTTTGTAGDDILFGGDGPDSLNGGGGDDILTDGSGADTLRGGSGSDTFVLASDGMHDVVQDFDPEQDTIDLSGFGAVGGVGNLSISTRSWGAYLRLGDDVFEIRLSHGGALSVTDFNALNIITGGRVEVDTNLYPDPDPVDPPPPPPEPEPPFTQTVWPGPVPVFSGNRPSPVFTMDLSQASRLGTAAGDNITTFGASDYIFGLFGNDTIRSANGNDSISADGGNDAINSGNGSDLVLGGTGFDSITAGSGFDTVAGGDGADSIRAGDGNDVLLGGQGYDRIYGEGGHDAIWGGATPDRLFGGGGNDFISAGSNFSLTVDGVWGEDGNDTIYGDGGYDFLDGGRGNDTIDGGAQADNLFGRDGQDLLLGSGGLDRLFGGSGDDRLYGGEGNDGHFGEGGDDSLWGGVGNDRFFGGPGEDVIAGGPGSDTIFAGSDFDTIVGGAGDDLLFGNFNADRFAFANFHGHDTIGDFNALNALERIDFGALTQIGSVETALALSAQIGDDVLITTGVASSVLLTGVQLADLGADDFLF